MAFYSKRCEGCLEKSKKIIKKIRYEDDSGSYYIYLFECDNLTCDIAYRMNRPKKKKGFSRKKEKLINQKER